MRAISKSLRPHRLQWAIAAAAAVAAMVAICPRATQARVVVPTAGAASSEMSDHVIVTSQDANGGAIDWTTRTLTFTSHSQGAIGTYVPPDVSPFGQRRAQRLAEEGLTRLLRVLVLGPTAACTAGSAQTPDAQGKEPGAGGACAPDAGWLLAKHDELAPLLHACVHSMQITRAVYGANGHVTLDVTLPIDLDAPGLGLLWAKALQLEPAPWAASSKAPQGAPVPSGSVPLESADAAASPPTTAAAATGIIINARGTGFVPALWPRIVDTEGTVLYGPHGIPQDVLVLRGLMGATKSLDAALGDARVAPLGIILRAQNIRPGDPHTLVLGAAEAATLQAHAALCREARVLALVD